ncbi:MAG: chemotaxis protein CheA [ANME-2 cluster archaeon]|jgi:two-component system chemotaxis sensor kinase CheA|nr:chemotaxis protein CheA [ANME-2 cluster archaeon]
MDMSKYVDEFKAEAREHLQIINQALLDLEKNPNDLTILDIIFRSAHTLKSSSATMEYTHISNLTHEMENVLDVLRTGDVSATSDTVDVLFECADLLEDMVNDVPKGKLSNMDVTPLTDKLKGTIENMERKTIDETETSQPSEEDDYFDNELINSGEYYLFDILLEKDCGLKSIRALMILKAVEEYGKIIDTTPSRIEIEDGKFDLKFKISLSSDMEPETIKNKLQLIPEVEKVGVILVDKKPEQPQTDTNEPNAKNELNAKTLAPKTNSHSDKIIKSAIGLKSNQGVRVQTEKLDDLMNLVGELVISKIRLMQVGNENKVPGLKEILDHLNILTTDLQNQVMQMRLVSVERVFNRFPRMIRDLSKTVGKDIELVIEGSDIELDRTVLDEIGEPLVHLLRNCVDHGIESPDERLKRGKKQTGTINLTASRDKQRVIFTVEDDGKGIDPHALRKMSVIKGIISAEDASKLSDEEAFDLIFRPGFSTVNRVSDVSGRGVGMDIVKTKITSLNGSINVNSTIGVGTKLSLHLPISMAIIQALIVGLNDKIYAIPISNILSTIIVKKEDLKTINGQPATIMHEQVLPLLDLSELFGENRTDKSEIYVVVIERNFQMVGLIVDTLIDRHEIVIKSFDNTLKHVEGFSGATILGDGNVVPIIDTDGLFNLRDKL